MLVVLMIIPIPTWLLDFLLSMNIALALVIMLTTLYTENALAFSVFPTLLLIITLFRLALNITGTRLILLHGYAGEVINAFGNFVVGGNYAVGVVIFAILIIIQFVVITNGAGRVAEVAARPLPRDNCEEIAVGVAHVGSASPTRRNEFTYMIRRLGPNAQCLNASVSAAPIRSITSGVIALNACSGSSVSIS